MSPGRCPPTQAPGWRDHPGLPWGRIGAMLLLGVLGVLPLRAEIQFDVFLGFDDHIREGHWFPVSFEIHNDGPGFTGTVSVAPEGGFESQRRSFTLELPTGTRKRVGIPVFSAAGRYSRWEARLQNPAGKIIAEKSGIIPKDSAAAIPILGAIPRTFGGLPSLPEISDRAPEFVPAVARLQTDLLPIHPLAYESLTAIYLNSGKAADLKPEQVDAMLTWLHLGGHLIVAVEQPTDVTAVPWLDRLLPLVPENLQNRRLEGSFERWLANGKRVLQLPSLLRRSSNTQRRAPQFKNGKLVPEPAAATTTQDPFTKIEPQVSFNNAEMPVLAGTPRDGETILSLGDIPLIQSAPRGRGTITVLAFSPEREPFRSWKNRPWFWARLIGAGGELFQEDANLRGGGPSIDGIFGAMLDSRQVRKLPVAALLLILIGYLAVIGPFDRWILKRTGKEMWTWITFPAYVVVFSGLIYFIGYKLRAGQLEWNEIQVIDQLPRPEGAAFRGRTWASIYSPANARYRLASDQPYVTLRPEMQPPGAARGEAGRLVLRHPARGLEADISVPVWVSQLYCSDWLDTGPALMTGLVEQRSDGFQIAITNHSSLRFSELYLAVSGRMIPLHAPAPGAVLAQHLPSKAGLTLDDTLSGIWSTMETVNQRRNAFGGEGSGQLARGLQGLLIASLSERIADSVRDTRGECFTVPSGFDVNPLLLRSNAVLFAWASGQSIAPAIHRFSPIRIQRDTALRVTLDVRSQK